MFFKGPTTHNCAGKSKRISHCKWQSGKHVETKWFGGPSESKSKTTSLLVGIVLFYTLNALLLAIHKECMPWIVIGGRMSWRKTSCGLQPSPPVLHDRMHHLATQLGLMEEMTSAMLNPPTSLSIPQHPSTLGYSIIFVDLLYVLCITLEPSQQFSTSIKMILPWSK